MSSPFSYKMPCTALLNDQSGASREPISKLGKYTRLVLLLNSFNLLAIPPKIKTDRHMEDKEKQIKNMFHVAEYHCLWQQWVLSCSPFKDQEGLRVQMQISCIFMEVDPLQDHVC